MTPLGLFSVVTNRYILRGLVQGDRLAEGVVLWFGAGRLPVPTRTSNMVKQARTLVRFSRQSSGRPRSRLLVSRPNISDFSRPEAKVWIRRIRSSITKLFATIVRVI